MFDTTQDFLFFPLQFLGLSSLLLLHCLVHSPKLHSTNRIKNFLLQDDSTTLFSKYDLPSVLQIASPQSNVIIANLHISLLEGVSLLKGDRLRTKNQDASLAKKASSHFWVAEKGNQAIVSTGKGLGYWTITVLKFLKPSNDCTHRLLFPRWLLWGIPLPVFLIEGSSLIPRKGNLIAQSSNARWLAVAFQTRSRWPSRSQTPSLCCLCFRFDAKL